MKVKTEETKIEKVHFDLDDEDIEGALETIMTQHAKWPKGGGSKSKVEFHWEISQNILHGVRITVSTQTSTSKGGGKENAGPASSDTD